MRAHGYVEGHDFDFVFRLADDDYGRLPTAAEELLRFRPDVIVAIDPIAAGVIAKATSTIPIVAPILVSPVTEGLAESYERPGANLTGISIILRKGKLWREIFDIARELIPNATAFGVLLNPNNPLHALLRDEIESGAAGSAVKITYVGAGAKANLDPAFKALLAAKVQAVLVVADPMFRDERERIAELAVAARLPTLANEREFVEAGCLISFGLNLVETERTAADFVYLILRGERPGDIPIDFPKRFEMVVNLKTAHAIGIDVPASILSRAYDVIQ